MDGRALLQRYHERPGRTVTLLEGFRDPEGRSTYEVLVNEAEALPRDGRVLDLACGDGYLLSLLSQRGFRDLAGVDRSPEELAAARERLGPAVELHCQDACALSLPGGSVDMVVCHMALMLMEPAGGALSEIARVLRPGAAFAAIMNRPLEDAALEVYGQELNRVTAEEGLAPVHVGDPRTLTVEGLRELVHDQPFDRERLDIERFEVRARATPAALWSMLRLSYDVFLLPEPAEERLRERLLRAWSRLSDEQGLVSCGLGMHLLRCRTPARPA